MPTLYIIAGPNGAGKTTASKTLLPDVLDCREFVNADAIAAGLSPFQPEKVAFQAGRIMLQRIQFLLHQRETFALETTLSTKSYKALISQATSLHYEIVLLYFWLDSTELAIERVNHQQENAFDEEARILKSCATLGERILKGLTLSYTRLVEEAKKNDDYLVFSENGKIVKVQARDIKSKSSAF